MLAQIVGANTTLIEPITPKLVNQGQVFQKTLFIEIRPKFGIKERHLI